MLAICKRDRGFELAVTMKQIQVVVRAELEPETAGLRVRHADYSDTLPPQPKGKDLLAGKRETNAYSDLFNCVCLSLQGTVIIIANHGDRIDIPSGAILENKIVSGNLRILQH